jgi:hypothetical protein
MVSVSSQNSVVQTRTNNIRTAVRLVLKPVLMRQNGVQNNAFQAVSATLMIMFVRTVAMVVFARFMKTNFTFFLQSCLVFNKKMNENIFR